MLRQGIRRCAGLASSAASSSVLLRSRAALRPAASLSRCNASQAFKILPLVSRFYSSEAAAAQGGKPEPSDSQQITKFAQLAELGVHSNLLKAITDDMKYHTMSPVQAMAIAPALKGTDIVAQAKTGTGKTIAFLLPLLQRMIAEDPSLATKAALGHAKSNDIRGIVLSPTRELAEQIAVEARRLTQYTGLVVQSAVGGTQKSQMLRQTQRQGCHLLVATPGRLNDLLQDPSSGIDAPKLAALVLDEADRMLDVGFEQELRDIQSWLPSTKEKTRQTLLVSATIPDNVIRLARTMVRPDNFEFVQTISENESLTHERVPQHIVPVHSWANIFPAIFEFCDREIAAFKAGERKTPFKAIIYFNTTALVEFASDLAFIRRRNGAMRASSFSIHSKLSQQQRTRAADSFRNASCAILLSSDVTARGMDFPNVSHVVQIDTPRDRESYIHRLGRTARQNKEGEGWLLVPQVSLQSTRSLIGDLPLQQNNSIKAASVKVESGDTSEHHGHVLELMRETRACFSAAYKSVFGHGTALVKDKNHLVDDLNLWAVKGCGLAEPPAVGMDWARQLGLSRTNLNIYQPRNRNSFGDDEQRQGSGGSGSSDPFSDMGRQVRRDGMSRDRMSRDGGGFSRNGGGNSRYGGGNSRSGGGYSRNGGGFSRGGGGSSRNGGDRRGSW